MAQNVIIVGAGIIGAAVAYQLQSQGAQVTVVHDGRARATDASFGWINASFFLDHAHFRLRHEGIAAWHRLMGAVALPIRQTGCLCWEQQGTALHAQAQELRDLGYPLEIIDRKQFQALEPHVADAPEQCLYFPDEIAIDSAAVTQVLLDAAVAEGAKELSGLEVQEILCDGGRVTGVQTPLGPLAADQVLVAAGTGTQALMHKVGVHVPMVERPALVLTTNPLPKLVDHVLVSALGEVTQCENGALIHPVAVGHQSDAAERIDLAPDEAGDAALLRLKAMFPDVAMSRAGVQLAHRPVPEDGMPVVGGVEGGLYVAVMHSGITLAAIMAELIAEELQQGVSNQSGGWLGPYRPERFAALQT